jgi:hypothetical protein
MEKEKTETGNTDPSTRIQRHANASKDFYEIGRQQKLRG